MGKRFLECPKCRTRYRPPAYSAGEDCEFCDSRIMPAPPPVLTDEEIDEAAFHAAWRDAVRTPQGNIRLEW